ncbi:MAG: 4Fe-4S binding protein [Candidatus Omnitrophica bacterium]|nr:4Fe-4S binding protein [Candidatus Omnitrophota bacterium]
MKQIVIISGKGGTGKTIITGAFAALAKNKVMADCDVDAADLHLLLKPQTKERHIFKSGVTAFINKELCTQCGKCIEVCRFDAITATRPPSRAGEAGNPQPATRIIIDPVSCEGCAFCSFVCPVKAIEMRENISGEWFVSDTRFGSMVHAKLGVAEENSGKLVSLVREKAKEIAESKNSDWIIIDGSPGIGCPVIASITGADCALVVTEPTLSGLHDADRVIKVAKHFNVSVRLVVNKYDLNKEMTEKIKSYCQNNNIGFIGKIGFDEAVVKSMIEGKTVIEYPGGNAKEEIIAIWDRLQKEIK